MNSGLNSSNPTLVAAFRNALLHQGIIVFLVFALLAVAWVAVREWLRPAAAASVAGPPAKPWMAGGPGAEPPEQTPPEPAWRQLLRIGFGVLWIVDGLLQAQPAMAVGLPAQVIEPTAANSPG